MRCRVDSLDLHNELAGRSLALIWGRIHVSKYGKSIKSICKNKILFKHFEKSAATVVTKKM